MEKFQNKFFWTTFHRHFGYRFHFEGKAVGPFILQPLADLIKVGKTEKINLRALFLTVISTLFKFGQTKVH